MSAELLPDPARTPEDLVAAAETRDALWAALGQLSPAQRAAIVQRFYLGMSENEMAASQRRSLATIKWHLHSARTRLRLLLALRKPLATDMAEPEIRG